MQDRYRWLEMKGQGSLGIVVRAYDEYRKENVAIKFAKKHGLEDIRQLEHEVLLLKTLQNEHVVRLLENDLQCKYPHFVMEFCDHGSLRNWIGQFPWTTVVSLLNQAAQGLQNIHDRGGFHGDIKPDNLLVQSSGKGQVLKIADFGTARLPGVGLAMDSSLRGTRGYIAPEVLRGKPFRAAADIYSLGIAITEVITCRRDTRSLSKINLPVELLRLIQAMTNICTEERPDARTILVELKRIPCIRFVVPTTLRVEIS